MKIILLVLFTITSLFADEPYIKSLRAYKNGNELSAPIIRNGEKLKIEFDIESDYTPDFTILFRFCDQNWTPYESIFLNNSGFNTEYNLWYDKLPTSVDGADYRYSGTFPSNNVKFPFSGKWKYYITDISDTSDVYGSGKFIFIDNTIPISVSLKRERLQGRSTTPSNNGQIYNITTKFIIPDSLEQHRVKNTEILANRLFDYPIVINRDFNSSNRYFEWNGTDQFQFSAQDIMPGNEYRQTNLLDINKYPENGANAQFNGVDVARNFKSGRRDFNGAYKLINPDNTNADYFDVTFELRAPSNIYKDIFLTGSFVDWKIFPEFVMNQDENGIYNITLELKRGIYDYQYVTGNKNGNKVKDVDWFRLEGNDWYTKNEYFVFVYYKTEKKGGYDEIIGYKQIVSK
jgi:hypothetical protein